MLLLTILVIILSLWCWWLLWDRGKKIKVISERKRDIRILRRMLENERRGDTDE